MPLKEHPWCDPLRHVAADVRFFQPLCRFFMFHDIVDEDAAGVRMVWERLSRGLLRERERLTASDNSVLHNSNPDLWYAKHGYFLKACTQQVNTARRNFGLGLISAEHLQSSWLDD